jgi:hypothetical protein
MAEPTLLSRVPVNPTVLLAVALMAILRLT